MSYSTGKLSLIYGAIGGGSPRMWDYWTADSIATVVGAGYISDAGSKGMLIGDLVRVFVGTLNTTGPDQSPSTHARGTVSEFASAPTWAFAQVNTISAGAATLKIIETQLGVTVQIGQATSALVGFFGTAPVSQRVSASLTATVSLFSMTGASFVANTSTTVSGVFGFNSTLASQLIDAIIELRAWPVAYGLHKGGA